MKVRDNINYLDIISAMRPISTVASYATFIRVLNTRHFPTVFLLLPSLLVVILAFERNFASDRQVKCMFTGAAVGLVVGFLSDADKLPHLGSSVTKVNLLGHRTVDTHLKKVSTLQQFVSALELLHIPVLFGTIVYTFCVIFNQLPPMRLIVLSLALSVCCSIMITLMAVILEDNSHFKLKTSYYALHSYIDLRLLFILVFTLAIFPSIHGARKKTWLILLNIFVVNVLWQIDHLDSTQWQPQSDVSVGRFPVAGSICSIIFVFAFHCLPPRRQKHRVLHWTDSDDEEEECNDDITHERNAFVTWCCGAFVAERLILFYAAQLRRTAVIYDQGIVLLTNMDSWSTCLLVICAGYLYSAREQVGLVRTVIIIVLIAGVYFSMGIIGGVISNGHFIDTLFSLAFLTIF